jgi:DNA-binding LacI/PurR family transcriptional regulator
VRGDPDPGHGAFDTVLVDNRGGARSAVRHLVALGHTEIAIISGPETSTPGRERFEGFREAIDHAGLELRPEHVESGAFRTREGYQAMLRLMGCPRPPTSVFVANNLMTLGALQALRDLSVSVPDEISIVGFDDHVFADLLAAPLTVVQRPMEEQGALATRLLLSRIQGRAGDTARRIVLDTSLVVRASSAAPATRRIARIARVADG